MRKTVLVVLVLALAAPAMGQALVTAPGSRAVQPVPPGEEPGAKAKEVVVRFLALTADQVTAWDALLATRKAAVEPLREQLEAVEEQLRDLLGEPSPDPAAVGNLVLQGRSLRQQIEGANREYVEGFEDLLTEEQAGKLAFLRRAERAQPLFPAFNLFGLLPPAPPVRTE